MVDELLRNDYDLNQHRVYNPAAPVNPTDIVRLQDLTAYTAPLFAAKYILQQPSASLPNAQALSALATGVVMNTTTTGVLSTVVFSEGAIPFGTAGGGMLTQDAANLFFDNANNRLGVGLAAPARALDVVASGDFQLRMGQTTVGGATYDFGRNGTDGLFYLYGNHAVTTGFVFTGLAGEKVRFAGNGDVTVAGLAGAGSTMVKVNASGTLARGTAGTDFELPLTFAQGVTRLVNNVTGDYITGKALGGGQTTWTGGTGSGEGIILRTTSHATKGKITFGTSAYDELNNRLGIGTLSPLVQLHSEAAGNFQIRLGQSAGADYDLGRNASDGLFYIHSNHGGTAGGLVIDGAGSERLRIAANGEATISNLGGASATLVKTTTAGLLQRATGGTDYEFALTFSQGVTRLVNAVTGDYITGKALGGGQTTWTGGTGSGEGIILRTTTHATKGKITFGTAAYDEANQRLGIGTTSPTAQLHSEAAGDFQLRLGQSAASDYDLGRNSSSGLFYLHSNHSTVSGLVIDGGGGEKFRVAANGNVTIPDLGGGTAAIVKASTAGLLQRATAGTDYEPGLTFSQGVTRAVNAVTGDYITGLTGNQTWTASTSSAGNLTLRTTSNSTKGDLTIQVANTTFSDGASATVAIKTNVANTGAIYGTTGTALHLGANNTTNYVQIGSTGQVVITDLGGGGSAIVKASVAGVLSRASAGVDYEALLTFTSGVTRATNTVTGDYITGKAGNQTWLGSTDSSGTLEIKSTSNATKGAMTLTALRVLLSNAETTFTNPTLTLDNTSASGQMGIHFKANGTLRGVVRADFNGSMNYATNGSIHNFYVGGDAGTGTNYFTVGSASVSAISSVFSINVGSPGSTNYLDAGPTGSRCKVNFNVGGVTVADNSDRLYFWIAPVSTTPITSAVTSGGHQVFFGIASPTFSTASGSPVINTASTLYIQSEPLLTGALTIVNPYALFVDSGRSRFDGDSSGFVFEVPSASPVGVFNEPDKYLKVWVPGTGTRYISMFSVT